MTPLRALFFLAAVTTACAKTIPSRVHDANSLERRIAQLAHHRFTAHPIESGIDKIKDVVRRIEERINEAESELIDALAATSTAVVKKVNDFILHKTGVNLQLDKKLESFEKKANGCNPQFKKSLEDVVNEIKTETKLCASTKFAAVKEIRDKIVAVVDILKVVPSQTIKKIKACGGAAPGTVAPISPETEASGTEAPGTEAPGTVAPIAPGTEAPGTVAPIAPGTEAPGTVAPIAPGTEAPGTVAPIAPGTEAPVALLGVHSVGSWWSFWSEAECVTKVLAEATKELEEVPEIVEKVVSDLTELRSKDTLEAVKNCAAQSIAEKPAVVQEAVARLTYCVIAPSKH